MLKRLHLCVVFCLFTCDVIRGNSFTNHFEVEFVKVIFNKIRNEVETKLPLCGGDIGLRLVEVRPENMTFAASPSLMSTPEALLRFVLKTPDQNSKEKATLHVTGPYFELRSSDAEPAANGSSWPSARDGERLFEALLTSAKSGVAVVGVVGSMTAKGGTTNDADDLKAAGASVEELKLGDYFPNKDGLQHAKMWLRKNGVTNTMESGYVGSSNIGWTSYSQVKNLGVIVTIAELLEDMHTIFRLFKGLAERKIDIKRLNDSTYGYSARYNHTNPYRIPNTNLGTYLSFSPPLLKGAYYDDDLETILALMRNARSSIDISVMNFEPSLFVQGGHPVVQYWPNMFDALRGVLFEHYHVKIRLLISQWAHSPRHFERYLASLAAFSPNLSVKIYRCPLWESNYTGGVVPPYSRVNHAKFMLIDGGYASYIGTSNWQGGYFTQTAGIGLVVKTLEKEYNGDEKKSCRRDEDEVTFPKQVQAVFDRDWDSQYATELNVSFHAEL